MVYLWLVVYGYFRMSNRSTKLPPKGPLYWWEEKNWFLYLYGHYAVKMS